MTITPNEISNKDFKKNFRGYDMDEVDTFLDSIREDYEKIYKINSTLKEQVIVLKEKVDHYTNMENTLQNTLVLAQSAAQQAKENSEKEANILIKDAERQAEALIKEGEKRLGEINKEYEFMKQQFNAFKSRFKGMVESQLETIEKIEIETGINFKESKEESCTKEEVSKDKKETLEKEKNLNHTTKIQINEKDLEQRNKKERKRHYNDKPRYASKNSENHRKVEA